MDRVLSWFYCLYRLYWFHCCCRWIEYCVGFTVIPNVLVSLLLQMDRVLSWFYYYTSWLVSLLLQMDRVLSWFYCLYWLYWFHYCCRLIEFCVGFIVIPTVPVSLLLQMDGVLCWFYCYTDCTAFTVATDGWSIALVLLLLCTNCTGFTVFTDGYCWGESAGHTNCSRETSASP